MKYVQKAFLEEHLCAIFFVRARLTICVRAHAHGLEGTLLSTQEVWKNDMSD